MKISKRAGWLLITTASLYAVACSDSDDDATGSGGSPASGGESATGGDSSSGGDASSGGSGATGGSDPAGGGPSTGGTGAEGGMGGDAAAGGSMGGFGGDPDAFDLEEACRERCETIVAKGCPDNDDQQACETDCVDGTAAGCESEYEAYVACDAALSGDDYRCSSIGPFNFVAYTASGLSECGDEKDAFLDCSDP